MPENKIVSERFSALIDHFGTCKARGAIVRLSLFELWFIWWNLRWGGMLVLLELFFWTQLGGWKHYTGFLLLPWTSDSKSYFEAARGKESGGKFTTPKSHFPIKLRCEQSCSLDSQPQSYYRRININKVNPTILNPRIMVWLVRKIKTKQKHLSKIN